MVSHLQPQVYDSLTFIRRKPICLGHVGLPLQSFTAFAYHYSESWVRCLSLDSKAILPSPFQLESQALSSGLSWAWLCGMLSLSCCVTVPNEICLEKVHFLRLVCRKSVWSSRRLRCLFPLFLLRQALLADTTSAKFHFLCHNHSCEDTAPVIFN